MNTTAVFVGLFYGILSVALCYFVSMLTSGLFARPFYRLYSGVLIGICSLMLISPGLRWLALSSPQLAVLALTLAQYSVIGVLGYGVYRFNREYLKRLFLERTTAAYFTFGTLANAAVVTIAFLHVAISGIPRWQQLAPGYLTAGNYGPIFVLLAAMVFHTDYHLKQSLGNLRRFSRFTFVGYAISFIGLGLSLVPYVGIALGQIKLVAFDSPLLQNFFSAQAVLIAIVLYAWLVWRYESIPPLFLLLLAIIGEYHILVSQWVIRSWGVESWALASLPLFAGLMGLDHYFAHWDQRKRSASGEADSEAQADAEAETADTLRFAMPFRWVGTLLAISLFAITLWARFFGTAPVSPTWLGVTFTIYALFFVALALFRREPRQIYASGLLAGLAALLSTSAVGGELATSMLAVMAAACSATAVIGARVGLKLSWKTPLTDCALLSAIVVTLLVLWRQLPIEDRYFFPGASPRDAIALACATFAYLATAHQYRSRLPVYGALIALAMMVPTWSAALGLAATVAAAWIERRYGSRSQGIVQEPVPLLGIARLPAEDTLPSLYVRPLSLGAIPLALIGLLTSATSIVQRDFTLTVLAGAAISALVLGLLTTRHRQPWLYLTSLIATYFAVHSTAHAMLFQNWPLGHGMPAHLLLAACLSLLGGMIAVVYSAWCAAMLRRVAEVKEPALRANRAYYAGWLFHTVSVAAAVTLVLVLLTWASKTSGPLLLLVAAALISLLFAGAAAVYRTQLGSYLSLSALSLTLLIAGDAFDLPRWDGAAMAAAGLCAAAFSWLTLRWSRSQTRRGAGATEPDHWLGPTAILPAQGMALWSEPLTVYAMICTVPAVLASMRFSPDVEAGFQFSTAAPISFLLTGITVLLCTRIFRQPMLYVIGVGLGFAAAHAATALWLVQKNIETLAPLVHIVVAAGTSLVCCGAGALTAIALNRAAWRSDEERRKTLVKYREFYAAPLVHVAFAASLLVLVGLAYAVTAEDFDTFQVALWSTVGSLLTAVTFGLSAVIYQSRISTYCALVAGGLAAHAAVAMFVPVSFRLDYQTLVIAASAVLLGGVSYWIARWEPRDVANLAAQSGGEGLAGSAAMQSPRLLQCCQWPPLPLVSRDVSLWSIPPAHGSVVHALLGLLLVGQTWPEHHGLPVPTLLKVLPIYLAAIALLIATITHRTGWLQFGIHSKNLKPWQRRVQGDWAERGVLYVLSLLSLGTAIHMTAQRVALDALPQRLALNWHLFVAAVLVLIGWSVATLLTLRLRNRTQRFAAFTEPERAVLAADLELTVQGDLPQAASAAGSLYTGLLHHVCLAAAIGVFGVAGTLTVASPGQAGPLLGSLCFLILYFGLAADSYRSQLGSYLSILSIGLAALQISAIAAVPWPWLGSLGAPTTAMLGLALISAATWLAKLHQNSPSSESGESRDRFYSAAPWPRSPLPLGASSPLLIWLVPLRQLSLLLALVSLAMVVSEGLFVFTGQFQAAAVLTACLLAAATFTLAARLEDAPLLTYFAAIVSAFGSVALLATLALPITLLGIALAALALALWIAGFGVERWQRSRSGSTAELLPAAVVRIYEQPLIRCSAALAGIAVGHSLLVWLRDGGLDSLAPLVIASALGAVTLMLNARSLTVLERGVWARVMVHLACLSFAGCWLAASTTIWTPDVAIALLGVSWGAVAAVINRSIGARITSLLRLPLESSQREQGEKLLLGWASGLVLLALAMSIPVSRLLTNSLWNLMVVLAIATLAALGGGLRWRNVSAMTLSAVLLPPFLFCAIFVYGYQHHLPVYGHLLTAILAAVYLSVGYRVDPRRMRVDEDAKPFLTGVSQSLARLAQLLTGGGVLLAVLSIMQAGPALPAAMSLGLISTLWVWIAWDCGKESFAYAAIAGLFATVAYASDAILRISLIDNSVAAFSVIACSFLLYSINLLVSRADNSHMAVFLRPSYYAALALPITLIAAIPLDQPAVAAFALLAAGSFYITVTHQSHTRWTLYVAAALVNFAVYLWMPAASALTGLYQLYVIPAAITVLIFVQLHRNDLKPQVLTAIRFAASGCILAVSTSEVFFTKDPSIVQFVAVLMLSLAGITLGVSLRIKPFIYVGIAFMIVNVIGQLGLQIHREAGVMRAIILIGVGLAVLAMMIFFNIHRERILSQYRRFAVDKTWE